MDIDNFSVIEQEFDRRVKKIVWCTFTTINRDGRPRSRMLHPVWEGTTGWIATGRETLKTHHLAHSPWVSLTYWDPDHDQVYADCKAEWEDDPAEKERIWNFIKNTPEPLGYDLSMFWPEGPTSESYGVLKLTPWRIEISSLGDMVQGKPPQVWRQQVD